MVGILGALVAGCTTDPPDSLTLTQGTASAPGIISGQILNGTTQKPVQGLTVEVASGTVKTDTTDANGRFSVSGLTVTAAALSGEADNVFFTSTPHQVRIIDKRSVGSGSSQVPSEADRLSTLALRVHILQVDEAGTNPKAESDIGLVRMNPGVSLNVLVTVDGAPAPAGVTVAAYPDDFDGTCSGFQISPISLFGSDLVQVDSDHSVPLSGTTDASGLVALSGLDKCQEYQAIVPAQVVGGFPMGAESLDLTDLAEGTPNKTIALTRVSPDEDIELVGHNMSADRAFFEAGGSLNGGFFGTMFDADLNVSNAGTFGITQTGVAFTTTQTGNLILVFRVPVALDNIPVTILSNNELVDPDPADDGIDATFGETQSLAGVSASLDGGATTGSVLTIAHTTDLTANQYYRLTGTLRNAANNRLYDMGDELGPIYVSDGTSVPSLTTIALDNRTGNGAGTIGQAYLVFNEAVAGIGRVVSITPSGGTATTLQSSNFSILPANPFGGNPTFRIASTLGDGGPTCDECLGSGNEAATRVRIITDATLGAMNNGDSVVFEIDVVDMQGNRFADRITKTVD
jgi:hypothetical protein